MNNGYDVNQALQVIMQMKNEGRNPQQVMQMMIQQNPQIKQRLIMLQNMSKGKSPQEFISQLAKQNGVSEQNMAQLMQMFGKQ
jgi:uncharacterized protein YutE (UPF0331/DUF86 family)